MGRLASFIRLAGCNLTCTWCDTPYTWDWAGINGHGYDPDREVTRRSVDDLVSAVLRAGAPLTVITGGEPLGQRSSLVALVGQLVKAGQQVEIETNATISPPPELAVLQAVRWNASPKLANSGIAEGKRLKPAVIAALAATGRVAWKFVVSSDADLDEITALDLDRRHVWLMPEGTDGDPERLRWATEAALAHGWNVTPRLHLLVWGNERGH